MSSASIYRVYLMLLFCTGLHNRLKPENLKHIQRLFTHADRKWGHAGEFAIIAFQACVRGTGYHHTLLTQ